MFLSRLGSRKYEIIDTKATCMLCHWTCTSESEYSEKQGWNFLEPSKDERSFEHSKLVNCTRLVEDEQVELKLVRNLCNILHVEFKLMGSGMKHEWNVLSGH